MLLFLFVLVVIGSCTSSVDVIIHQDASFEVVIEGAASKWSLSSSTFAITNKSQWFTYPQFESDNILVLDSTKQGSDSDELGNFNFTRFDWTVDLVSLYLLNLKTSSSTDVVYVTTIKEYDELSAVVFEQFFPIGLQNTQNTFGDTSTTGGIF